MTFPSVPISSETAVDVVATLTLSVGRNYGAQYQGPGAVNLRESDSATRPDITESAARATSLRRLAPYPEGRRGDMGMGDRDVTAPR